MASNVNTQLGFAGFFAAVAVVFVAVGFATEHWVEVTVNRQKLKDENNAILDIYLKSNKLYFTSYRGLFRTCYPGNETAWLDNEDSVLPGNCLPEMGYELTARPETQAWGDSYQIRIHLLRSHFGFFVGAMVMYVIGAMLGIAGCYRVNSNYTRAAGLVVFVGAFFVAGGMAFFHGYEFLEKQMITAKEAGFPAYWMADADHTMLADNTSLTYGYSYMFGWISMGLGCIAAILYLCAAFAIGASEEEKEPLAVPDRQRGGRNRAYDYMQQDYTSQYGGQPQTHAQPQIMAQPQGMAQPQVMAQPQYMPTAAYPMSAYGGQAAQQAAVVPYAQSYAYGYGY